MLDICAETNDEGEGCSCRMVWVVTVIVKMGPLSGWPIGKCICVEDQAFHERRAVDNVSEDESAERRNEVPVRVARPPGVCSQRYVRENIGQSEGLRGAAGCRQAHERQLVQLGKNLGQDVEVECEQVTPS